MKRRDFMQTAGVLGAAGTSLLAEAGRAAPRDTTEVSSDAQNDQNTKSVLITSAHSQLAQAIAAKLTGAYQVHLTSPIDVVCDYLFEHNELGPDDSTNALVRGADAIVHVAAPLPDSDQSERIDYCTRCTYNLLKAATDEGVRTVVYLSSLNMMLGYDEDYEVIEDWRPLISSNGENLSAYLGEFTCREFAHESKLRVVVLRLGKVVRADDVQGKPFDPLWVDQRDVAQAVSKTLDGWLINETMSGRRWTIFHILSGSPHERFSSRRAQQEMDYNPQFSWS